MRASPSCRSAKARPEVSASAGRRTRWPAPLLNDPDRRQPDD